MQSDHAVLFREYLATSDLNGLRSLWAHVAPHLPQPNGDYEVQVMMHMARTQSESIALNLRVYSHQWLLANGLPSQLPDRFKPVADRAHNGFALGVGIAMVTDDPAQIADPQLRAEVEQKRKIAKMVQRAMGDAVEEAFAEGRKDTPFLRQRMGDARERVLRRLGGPRVNVSVNYDFSNLHRPA